MVKQFNKNNNEIGVELDGLTLSVEYGTRDMLYKKRNNLISKNRPFKKFGGPKFQRFILNDCHRTVDIKDNRTSEIVNEFVISINTI